jgi:hypothetical protein
MAYIAKASNAGGFKSLNRYYDMLAGNTAFVDTAYESIATVTIGAGGATTATFSSIPQTYTDLQIRLLAKNADGNPFGGATMSINGGAGEARHDFYGTGSAVGASGVSGSLLVYIGGTAQFGVGIVDILDYTNANKTKTSRSLSGVDNNGSGLVAFESGLETTQTAISSLTFTSNSGNFAQYSSFALYGIKG